MRTPISYYGGKQNMLKHILPRIPEHEIYVEPFVGGGAVFWAKKPSYLEVLNDMNGFVMNFYRVLKQNFNDLLVEIESTLLSEELHSLAYKVYNNPQMYGDVKQAWAFWFLSNFSFNNDLTGGIKFDNGTAGSHVGRFTDRRKQEFVYAYSQRLKYTHLPNRDAISIIGQRNKINAFHFLDPPYPKSNQGHYKGYTIKDLTQLLEKCENITGRFMLSNYNLPIIRKFAEKNGWIVEEFDMRLSASRENKQRKKEILVMNYEIQKKKETTVIQTLLKLN